MGLVSFLVPKLHLGTHLLRQFYCRSQRDNASLSQREIEFREEQEAFPNGVWERGKVLLEGRDPVRPRTTGQARLSVPLQGKAPLVLQPNMIRLTFLALLLGVTLFTGFSPVRATTPSPPVDFKHLPWTDGEALTYLISWSTFEAAQGTFVARDKGDHWEFKLALASRGLVDDFYPFTGTFWCILAPPPWRSVEYGEYRFEPNRTVKERTRIDYAQHLGTREIWMEGKTKTFPIAEAAVDDIGTMLYHLRAGAWNPGDRRLLHVYESDSEKEALSECQARETRAFGIWPPQPLLRILVLPGKGTHHRGRLMLWMTDDARHLPVHADLDFRYGSFSIDLTKAGSAVR